MVGCPLVPLRAPVPKAETKDAVSTLGTASCCFCVYARWSSDPEQNSLAELMAQHRILVSACLLGEPVRYNGRPATLRDELLEGWQTQGMIVPLCPEIAAGFAIPRRPAEIEPGRGGEDVWYGNGSIVEDEGADVTTMFRVGAQIAVELAAKEGCRFALLTDGSPSCGTSFIYSGLFDGSRRDGQGVVAAALRQAGVQCFGQSGLKQLRAALEA